MIKEHFFTTDKPNIIIRTNKARTNIGTQLLKRCIYKFKTN